MSDLALCLFCKIVQKEIPSKMVYEDDEVLAFEDVRPQAPVHILVIPKAHFTDLLCLDRTERMSPIFSVVTKLAKEKGIDKTGFRTVINTGREGGQTVFHLHVHLLGGRPFHWPPG